MSNVERTREYAVDESGGGLEVGPSAPRRGFVTRAGAGLALPAAGGEVLASAADSGGQFSLLRSSSPAGDRVPPHVHDETDECFFVLEGMYHVECGTDTFQAEAGTFVYLPRGVTHSYTVGPTAATKLILAVPGGIEDFFADMGSGLDAAEIANRHGVRFLHA